MQEKNIHRKRKHEKNQAFSFHVALIGQDVRMHRDLLVSG
jgi:hypothetical protein